MNAKRQYEILTCRWLDKTLLGLLLLLANHQVEYSNPSSLSKALKNPQMVVNMIIFPTITNAHAPP